MSHISLEQIAEFFKKAANGEITEELFKRFMENPHAATVPLSTLGALVAGARFKHVDDDINTDNFPLKGEFHKSESHQLVWFNEKVRTAQVFNRLLNLRFLPGGVEHLAYYAGRNRDKRSVSIVALDSTFVNEYGLVQCPYVYYDPQGRMEFGVCPFDQEWEADCRFLVRPAV